MTPSSAYTHTLYIVDKFSTSGLDNTLKEMLTICKSAEGMRSKRQDIFALYG